MKLIQIIGFRSTKTDTQKRLLAAGVILLALLVFAAVFLSIRLLSASYVYSGVYLDGVPLEGLDESELMEYLQSKYENSFSSLKLKLYHRDYSVEAGFEELNVQINSQSVFQRVYGAGRQGNFIQRLAEIFRLQKEHLYAETDVSFNQTAVNEIIDDIYNKTYVPAEPPSLLLLENEVFIHSGSCGYQVNKDRLRERIIEQIRKLKSGIVIVPVEEILPAKMDADSLYNEIIQEPADAGMRLINGNIEIIPEQVGRTIDKAEFLSLIAELEAKSVKYPMELKLPVKFIQPQKTAENIKASLLKDTLSSYTTEFPLETENDKNRAVNIKLTVEAINGVLLMPGDSFSFNDTVGKRTAERGYKVANIYGFDGITSGIGGGICQVSSTLYNAALKANLQIDERNPHIYTVAYVPLGRDAAVSYGTEDLRFTNSTGWPIRIEGKVSGNEVVFTITGTNENPSLQITVQPSLMKLLPYETEYIEDQKLAPGTRIVKQSGMNGAVVDTYLLLKKGDTVISSKKLHTSTYRPLPEIVHVAPGYRND